MNIPTLDRVPGSNLYIGGFIALRRPKALANCHIAHIVSVLNWHFDDASELIRGYKHLHIPVDDVDDENLLTWFPRSNSFIEEGLKAKWPKDGGETKAMPFYANEAEVRSDDEGGVLVHCAMGKSRSATIVLAYLLWASRRAYDAALFKSHATAIADTVALPPQPLAVIDALILLRQGRGIAEPNEGFMDQLHLYYDMGCPDNVDSHRLYKRWLYQRSVAESLSINRAPELDDLRFEDEDDSVAAPNATVTALSSTPSRADTDIKCRKCRRLLTKSFFIQTHEPPNGKPAEECAHIFLHPLSWMKPAFADGQLDGRLTCPNEKCRANVGKFAWQGMRCSCGGWIVPGFAVQRARIDEVRAGVVGAGGAGGMRLPPGTAKRGGGENL